MISLLSKLFIKDRGNYSDPKVRRAYGMLCSVTGIALNVLLFIAKYAAGVLSGSVAITADAFNNLSDAGSSVITLVGFKFAGKRADRDHPFGHGRIEYVSGLAVSVIVIVMGIELAKTSVLKIIAPTAVTVDLLSAVILAVSIGVKTYMYLYNRSVGAKINSGATGATAADSISDAAATTVVLVAMLVSKYTGLMIDGWCGLLVALFILYNGAASVSDTLSPLLGKAPDPEFVRNIEKIVMSHSEIEGIHDLAVHDYGPGRLHISLHAEVPADGDILALHDSIDLAERELRETLGCEAVIHMDPISTNDDRVTQLRVKLAEQVKWVDDRLSIHDFRIVEGPTHTNLIFDVVTPPGFPLSDAELTSEISGIVEKWDNCFAVITVDKSYI